MAKPPRIPDDPEQCRRLLGGLLARVDSLQCDRDSLRRDHDRLQRDHDRLQRDLAEARRVLDATAADHERLQGELAEAREIVALLRRWIFSQRRERHVVDDPNQGHLFDLEAPATTLDSTVEPTVAETPEPAATTSRSQSSRRVSLDHLPQHRVEHDLPEAEKVCACCGGAKTRIGEDVSRELEYVPAKLEVLVHVRPKYACSKCRDGVASPPVPPRPVPRGIAGPGLVSYVLVSKFADHLPLYRLEDILFRHGVQIARSTLCDWVRNAAELLEPLAALQRQRILTTDLLWTDETHVTALVPKVPGGSTKARFWVYIGPDTAPYSVYDFTMSRQRDGPARFLKEYRGFLHADAYGGYDGIYLARDQAIVEVACWSHARRKFFEARSNAPREANTVLEWIRQLYDLEYRARELASAERQALREQEALPILDRLESYLDEIAPRVLPKSSLGKALTYARNQRAALRRYVTDGRLTIDNNVSERTLRLQAIGRKNWEFLGSEQAGPRAAVLFTILAGAKRHRLEPWTYVRDVLLRLAGGATELESLLPDRWAAAHPESVLEHRLEESRRKAARTKDIRKHRRIGRPRTS